MFGIAVRKPLIIVPKIVQGPKLFSVNSTSLAYTSNVTKGNLLVVGSIFTSGAYTVTLDSQGNTWTNATNASPSSTGLGTTIWSAIAGSSAADTITITSGGNSLSQIWEISGVDTLDQVSSLAYHSSARANVTSNTINTTRATEILIGVCFGNISLTAGAAGWTTTTLSNNACLVQTLIVSALGTFASTATQSTAQISAGASVASFYHK